MSFNLNFSADKSSKKKKEKFKKCSADEMRRLILNNLRQNDPFAPKDMSQSINGICYEVLRFLAHDEIMTS